EEEVDKLEIANRWRMRSEEYKRLEKDALIQLDTLELEKGIKTDEESLFDETEGKVKREKKIEDIFDDPGFLEF
ncbi:MAG: hypothetical protein ACTSR7_20395, partial [Promethearchaeota archaeon]